MRLRSLGEGLASGPPSLRTSSSCAFGGPSAPFLPASRAPATPTPLPRGLAQETTCPQRARLLGIHTQGPGGEALGLASHRDGVEAPRLRQGRGQGTLPSDGLRGAFSQLPPVQMIPKLPARGDSPRGSCLEGSQVSPRPCLARFRGGSGTARVC